MSIYVDDSAYAFRTMQMCHMIADTPFELMAMADIIGVHRKHFKRFASAPHFDIPKSKRAVAVRNEAIELDRRAFVATMKRIRSTWPATPGQGWKHD